MTNIPTPSSSTGAAKASVQAAPKLQVHVVCGPIEEIGEQEPTANVPSVDVIAVGHYAQVEPQFAELALDNAISDPFQEDAGPLPQERNALGILRDFTGRGIIAGERGVPFFLPDPRDARRVIAIAGMGSVGTFGAPGLAFLARQLLWALSRLGRKHLATVLIGAGTGNLRVETAIASWMNGAALAIAGSGMVTPIQHVTFVEIVPKKAKDICAALLKFRTAVGIPNLDIALSPAEPIQSAASASTSPRQLPAQPAVPLHPVTRLWVERCGKKKYAFGWFQDQASHVEDFTELALDTILRANDELAAAEEPDHQRERAKFLFNLLVPKTLRDAFGRKDPIVIECDNRTAQLHWEVLAIPGVSYELPGYEFLGIHPTITRQFRKSFGILPEPPPRYDHTLRILIVADTDENRPLPAAVEGAKRIQELFAQYERQIRSLGMEMTVAVEALIGPEQATYGDVLKKLMKVPAYDILHFAGHCEYVKEDPATSGWLFSHGKKITAYELSRVDCVPGFVFSNACSSGELSPQDTAVVRGAAPSFAEAFLRQGVKNFICTAWPVDSNPARDLANRFYEVLLGVDSGRRGYIYEAMSEGRKAIWNSGSAGTRTWGAYQHYGNPWFKLS
jgi:CHAT domain